MQLLSSVSTRGGRARRHPWFALAVSVAAMAGLMAGCTPPSPPPPPPSSSSSPVPSSTSPSASPTPTPTPSQTQLEKDQAAAKQAILDWLKTLDKVSADPSVPLTELDKVGAGELLEVEKGLQREFRVKGWRRTGPATKVTNMVAGGVVTQQGRQRISVSYCADVTGIDVVDRNGVSQVAKGRPNKFPTVGLVEKINGRWTPIEERTEGPACG